MIFIRHRSLGHSIQFSHVLFHFYTNWHFYSLLAKCVHFLIMYFKGPGWTAFSEHTLLFISLRLPGRWIVLPHMLPIITREEKS